METLAENKITLTRIEGITQEQIDGIIETAEDITNTAVTNSIESYDTEVQRKFADTTEAFNFDVSQVAQQIEDLGGEIAERNQFIRLDNTDIIIGKSDSPVTTVITNSAVEFRYNNVVVAKFTNELLEVENIKTKNQVAFSDEWAIRPGANGNLNIAWIGG